MIPSLPMSYQGESYIHVVLPKTGSTFLQKHIFPKLNGVTSYSSQLNELFFRTSFPWLYAQNHISIHSSRLAQRRKLERIFHRHTSVDMGIDGFEKVLFSSEGFCGVSWDPCLNSDLSANLLKQQFPNGRIILFIRRQDAWCNSIWRQLVVTEDRFKEYFSADQLFSIDTPGCVPALLLRWTKLRASFCRVFGSSNVLVLPYELLLTDPLLAISQLCSFIGVDIPPHLDLAQKENTTNQALTYVPLTSALRFWLWIKSARRPNTFYFDTLSSFRSFRSKRSTIDLANQSLSNDASARLLMSLEQDNRELSDRIQIDLGDFSYY